VRLPNLVDDNAEALWEEAFQDHFDVLTEIAPNLTRSTVHEQRSFFLPDFANAYDSLVLVLEALARNNKTDGATGKLAQPEDWNSALTGINLTCLTGPIRMGPDLTREAAAHEVTLFKMAGGLPQVCKSTRRQRRRCYQLLP